MTDQFLPVLIVVVLITVVWKALARLIKTVVLTGGPTTLKEMVGANHDYRGER